jgi:cobalamin biosynthesis Co2+ chelatase CbiK
MKNCLEILFPEISAEWHPTKNGDLTPNMIVAGSHTVVWWQCKKGHEWKTSVGHRTQRKQNCPYCSGNRTVQVNDKK